MGDGAPTPAVGAVIRDDEGRLLLVRRGGGTYTGFWAVPGGRQRFGESMRAAVAREVAEETGLVVSVGAVVWVGDIVDPREPPSWHYSVVDFAATVVGGELRPGDDAVAVRFVALRDLDGYRLTPTMHELIAGLT